MRAHRSILAALFLAAASACAVKATRPSAPPPPIAPPSPAPVEVRCPLDSAAVERILLDAVNEARFDEVIDLGPADDVRCPLGPGCAPKRISRSPSVDVAVIAFPEGCPPAQASVMLSGGARAVPIDPVTFAAAGVRLHRWDQARWDADGAPAPLGDDDLVVPPRPGEAAFDFVVPYPASNFKLLVAVFTLALADRGVVKLDEPFTHRKETRPLRAWLSDMITWSDDGAAEALIRRLHLAAEAPRLDAFFADLGLTTLQIQGTSPKTGRSWNPGRFHMTAWDTARLLWLLDPEAPAAPWRRGKAPLLGEASTRLLLDLLGEQAFHDALSTTTICGRPGSVKGIPALLAGRWIDGEGRARVELGARGGDVRPCNQSAEVSFLHKTGLTQNFGSDAGIVRGIAGRARRHYLIAFFSNLGYRYTDADKAHGPNPCRELGICYTQRIPALGARIDAALAEAMERR